MSAQTILSKPISPQQVYFIGLVVDLLQTKPDRSHISHKNIQQLISANTRGQKFITHNSQVSLDLKDIIAILPGRYTPASSAALLQEHAPDNACF